MNGVHDMGGMHGMGPIAHEPNEPVFHEPWEGRVWGLVRAVQGLRDVESRACEGPLEPGRPSETTPEPALASSESA